MATTSPDNLYSPDGSNAYNIPAETGAMQTSVQTALVQRANFYRGTSAQRTALSNSGLALNGVYWSDTNGAQQLYRYSGSAWVNQTPGDTGWVNLTSYSNGFSNGGPSPAYRIMGGVVHLSGQLYRSSAPSSLTQAMTLPGAVPSPRSSVILAGVVGWDTQIQVTGNALQISSNTARTTGTGYTLDGVSWPV